MQAMFIFSNMHLTEDSQAFSKTPAEPKRMSAVDTTSIGNTTCCAI